MHHLGVIYQTSFELKGRFIIMKLSIIFAILVVGLAVQVRPVASYGARNLVSVQLQSNGAGAIFLEFLKPFFPGTITVTTGGSGAAAPTTSSSSSSNGSSTPASNSNMSAGALNNSNALFASNSNVSANINQTFGASGASDNSTAR